MFSLRDRSANTAINSRLTRFCCLYLQWSGNFFLFATTVTDSRSWKFVLFFSTDQEIQPKLHRRLHEIVPGPEGRQLLVMVVTVQVIEGHQRLDTAQVQRVLKERLQQSPVPKLQQVLQLTLQNLKIQLRFKVHRSWLELLMGKVFATLLQYLKVRVLQITIVIGIVYRILQDI